MLALTLITSTGSAKIPPENDMKLISPDFSDGGNIPERFTCEGKDVSPTLTIDGSTKETKSLVLIVDDPDAPGGNFTHWLMWNIVPDSNRDRGKQASAPRSARSERFREKQIQWPMPATQAYIDTISGYTRSTRALDLPPKSKRNVVDSAMKGHIIAEATLMGRYAKKGSKS